MSGNGGNEVTLNPIVDFLAGTIAGMAGLVVGFPFDTVKVRFQNPSIAEKYRSTLHAIGTIIREERVVGLYKGIMSPLATVALMNGLVFASYRFFMKIQLPNTDAVPSIMQIALAGAGSGIVSSVITTPTELIKIRQQSLLTQTTARKVALQIYQSNGILGFYRGISVTALRDCGYGAYFAAYEMTYRYFSSTQSGQLSWPAMMLAGGVAGVAGWVATFPLDVVKTRVQGSHYIPVTSTNVTLPTTTSPLIGHRYYSVADSNPFKTTWSTITYSYRTEGLGVFFRGLSPTLIRAIPVNMVTFATFEAVVHAFS